ncbi:MAG: hypothetical protein KOO62_07625 [candidate division Zixibacteria bacterium]|nr:hypothetical protein [candidate division Zixibacteria bacterium]
MMNTRRIVTVLLATALILAMMPSCANELGSDPKAAVIAMFGAMEKDDRATLAHILDLSELMSNLNEDYALQTNKPRVFTSPEQILDDLTGEGKTKKRWFDLQRIVNKAEVIGETATVEVTFVDKEQSRGWRTKFGLHKVHDQWKIYSFKTVVSEN